MNVLFAAIYPPDPPVDGGRLRTFNILKQAAARQRVTLLCFADALSGSEAHDRLRALCERVVIVPPPLLARRGLPEKLADLPRRTPAGLREWRSAEFGAAIRELAGSGHYDVAHVDHLVLAQYRDELGSLPVVLTHHNIEGKAQERSSRLAGNGALWRRLAQNWEKRRWVQFEIEASRKAQALITVSEGDARYFRLRAPGVPVYVVPNGVDTEYFRPLGSLGVKLLFSGRMDYEPNIDGIVWFCQEILPYIRQASPEIELVIVGRDPAPEVRALSAGPGVSVTGSVDDVRPYFAEAAVCVVPLRAGGGTRLKILEAMAMGVPCVSTALGSEGLDIEPEADYLCADAPDAFARQVLRILAAPALGAQLAARARRTVEQRYAWPVATAGLEEIYRRHGRAS